MAFSQNAQDGAQSAFSCGFSIPKIEFLTFGSCKIRQRRLRAIRHLLGSLDVDVGRRILRGVALPLLDRLVVDAQLMQHSRVTVAEHVGMEVVDLEDLLDALQRLDQHGLGVGRPF